MDLRFKSLTWSSDREKGGERKKKERSAQRVPAWDGWRAGGEGGGGAGEQWTKREGGKK